MTSLRRVRRVSLRAPNEALVRRGALLLEDALRTASWSLDVPGALVVVRRLDVGAIDPDESPAALSARIEGRLRALATQVVPATAPSAAQAAAVRFRDPVEPAILLAEHVARSSAPAPWFLARAVPAYRPEAGPRHALRAALAAARDASAAGPVALIEALLARGVAAPFFAALDAIDGPVLLAGLGLPWPLGRSGAASGTAPSPVGEPASTPVGGPPAGAPSPPVSAGPAASAPSRAPASPPADPSASTPVGPPAPPGPATSTPPGSVSSTPPGSATSTPPGPATSTPPGSATSTPAGATSAPAGPAPPDRGSVSIAPDFRDALAARIPDWGASDPRSLWLAAAALLARAPALRHDPRLGARAQALAATFAVARPSPPGAASTRAATPREGRTPQPVLPVAERSGWGGLLFLVPLLERLGMATFLAEHPSLAEAGFPVHVLRDVARRLGTPPDDPILLALGEPPSPLPAVPFTLPPAFARLAGPPPNALRATPGAAGAPTSPGSTSPASAPDALTAFRTALRRVTRRVIRMGLRSLVARPARVAFTRTHVDLVLDLRRVHLGIRRAGADIDPGYVPWLGRVIHFHYRHGEEPRA